jgi:L-ribulose-5-phosphate 3-epimerase
MPLAPTRRDFVAMTTSAALGRMLKASAAAMQAAPRPESHASASGWFTGPFCLFSKPLPDMDWARLSHSAREAGFDGLDLTVRPGGHVRPERAAYDLTRALEAARAAGVTVPMITTALTSRDDPAARPILSTAGRLGIRYCKAGYYLYDTDDVRDRVARAGRDFRGLVDLAAECGVEIGFHNHAAYIGAALWDAASFIEPLDAKTAGYYFDARHAVAEGGAGAWKSALHLAIPRLKMVAVKDFSWVKTPRGWEDANCPVGQGLVDWTYVAAALCRARFAGPISVHIEYDVPGATAQIREQNVLSAARRDLDVLKAHLRASCG